MNLINRIAVKPKKSNNKLACYSVQLDYSWEKCVCVWGFFPRNPFLMSSLSCVPSFNFLLRLQHVKQWCGGVVVVWWWWLKPILVFSLNQAEQHCCYVRMFSKTDNLLIAFLVVRTF